VKGSASREHGYDLAQLDRMAAKSRFFLRRMALPVGTLSTGVGGVVAATTLVSSASVQSTAPDFASCANLYTSYRIRALEVKVLPFFPVNTTAVTVPALIAVCPFQNSGIPVTLASILDATDSQCCSGYRSYTFTADWGRDPNAKLWTLTNTAVAAGSSFGVCCIGFATGSTASTPVWALIAYAVVEFQLAA